MNKLQPIEGNKRTITAMVQERIRSAILAGDLAAGSRLDQARLAEQLHVSLVPVREAIHKLEGEGFVQVVPRRGAFVTRTSIDDMEDLYNTRRLLEGEAAAIGALLLTDNDIRALDEPMQIMDKALVQHDYAAFMEANRRFHFIIYGAAGSRYLMDMIRMLWELAERYRYRYVFLRDRGEVIQEEHRRILECARRRDSRGLRKAIVDHMSHTQDGLKRYLNEQLQAQAE
jgi:DNA-binding GntR family transcriptional regulator